MTVASKEHQGEAELVVPERQPATSTHQSRKKSGVAADASFLETLDQTSSVLDLHRSNLLRLQTQELVEECALVGSSKRLPSWTALVGPFVDQLTLLLGQVQLHKVNKETLETCPFDIPSLHVQADKQQKLLESFHNLKKKNQPLQVDSFQPPTTAQATQALQLIESCDALTKASGNANVLPTFSLTVKMPTTLWDQKDFRNEKYFSKRNVLVWHVAQSLAHNKKHRNKVGTVYWKYERNDKRKACLVIIPPVTATNNNNNSKQKNKNKKKQKVEPSMMKTPKFRIQIRFEMESIDWIPPIRLIPNRNNIPNNNHKDDNNAVTTLGSPLYNQALLEDAYHAFLPHQHQQQRANDSGDGDSDSDDDEEEEHYPHWAQAVVLLKIWCLQRGLLRAHDGLETDQLALLILYLYRTKQANARMAPLQVMAVVFKCLAQTQWMDDTMHTFNNNNTLQDEQDNLRRHSPGEALSAYGMDTNPNKRTTKRAVLVMPAHGKNEAQTIAMAKLAKLYAQQTKENANKGEPSTLLEVYRRHAPSPVFLDSTMRYNYFGRLSPSFMQQAQLEAARSLQYLHSPSMISSNSNNPSSSSMIVEDPFGCLFMTPARFWDRFDLYFQIPLKALRRPSAGNTKMMKSVWSPGQQVDLGGPFEAAARAIRIVLQRALGDRVRSMRILSTGNGTSQQSHDDSDQLPLHEVSGGKSAKSTTTTNNASPIGDDNLVFGISLNVDTCARIVDRGPPPEQTEAVQAFVDLWGDKAELRRFKDGAIVKAVVWNTTDKELSSSTTVRYQNEDTIHGGIVERIVHYMLQRHFLSSLSAGKKQKTQSQELVKRSALRDMTSFISGVVPDEAAKQANDPAASPWFTNPAHAHRCVMKAFEALASFLKEHSLPTVPVPGSLEEKTSRLCIPLAIDAVEPLSPCLRYSELFPPIPHPFLGSADVKGIKKASSVIGFEPVCIQIRFGASSKWPTDLKAIGAAKTAMLIQLANGIEDMISAGSRDGFEGPIVVTPSYLELGFRGYAFRLKVRADPEIRLLRGLFEPSTEATALLKALTREHIVSAMHHSMIHAVHTKHPSAGGVVRLAMRWCAGHLFSGHIPQEAVELLVAKVYTDQSSPLGAPGSVAAGFLRFLQLLESHDWVRQPLIVDPHSLIDDGDRAAIHSRFDQVRGPNHERGPPLYIISPCDRQGIDDAPTLADVNIATKPTTNNSNRLNKEGAIWNPSFTTNAPERVILARAIALARKSREFLVSKLTRFDTVGWHTAFQESEASFKNYDALLRVDADLVVDAGSSSKSIETEDFAAVSGTEIPETVFTKSIQERFSGPKRLRVKLYRNMRNEESDQVLYSFMPVDALVESLRKNFGSLALFFYNSLCPEVIGIAWRRPQAFESRPFSAMNSEYAQPCVAVGWKQDTMMILNASDVLREMRQYFEGLVTTVKVFRAPVVQQPPKHQTQAIHEKKRKVEQSDDDDESSDSDSDSDSD
ncbi:Nucleolar protein 6 [Seminavis robusta]|uniref:Nucleolar protein 6 n=1 Tax=Seminavis robusta TaxID=568900 RepID=A0A9N8HJQ7_9STRA|nr:Nucleolar protein 6 [Seminavis robusta]|eukprot:Sro679_g186040.1 Nucleolar protein 6 (1473) ;mRNA; r:5628-10145